ncbi:stathmin-1-A [Peptacetobacter sp.]|uniref:stathmin-1-A n=1 Tax=Peptacetobacter sp. TaxID=2991975 RepID=UPI002E775686|nr:stathmin-1-A [Peptacetobacter sp.]MEE0452661.1 stathmin-1-A [Peptacetobacter sp.]
MKQSERQEQEFLSVCCSRDYELLTGKKTMTQKDYERITYLVNALGYTQYLQILIGRYMDMAILEEEHEEREREIYLEYPEYYEDEGIFDEMEQWLEDFLREIPTDKKEYFEQLIKKENL